MNRLSLVSFFKVRQEKWEIVLDLSGREYKWLEAILLAMRHKYMLHYCGILL